MPRTSLPPPARRLLPKPPRVRGVRFHLERVLRVERFFRKQLRLTKGQWAGRPFLLEPWQLWEIIAPIFGYVDAEGLRVYREGMVGVSKKSGKSPKASGIALYGLVADGEMGAEIYACAGDKDQARIVFGEATRSAKASPFLSRACRFYKDAIEYPPLESVFRVLSSDAPLKEGLNPHMTIIDELHVHRNSDLYWAMRQGTVARRQPLTLTITTAGPEDETDQEAAKRSIALQRYLHGRSGKDPRFFFFWRQAPKGAALTDFRAWCKANPASWRRTRAAHREILTSGIPEFRMRRFYFNQWIAAEAEPALPMAAWDRCKAPPVLAAGGRAFVGMDASLRRDRAAVVLDVFEEEDRAHNVELWIFERDRDTGFVPFELVEELVRDLARTYDVVEVPYNVLAFTRSALTLSDEGLTMVEVIQSSARMVPASQALYDAVVERRLRHGGNRRLRDQARAAIARETDQGWRFDKRKSRGPIEGIVAMAMAVSRAESGDGAGSPDIRILGEEEDAVTEG